MDGIDGCLGVSGMDKLELGVCFKAFGLWWFGWEWNLYSPLVV